MSLFRSRGSKDFIVALEDAGELLTIMGHTRTKDSDELKCDEKIVFVMDPLKSGAKKRKISKACQYSLVLCSDCAELCQACVCVCLLLSCGFEARPITFGSYMDPAKIRALRPPYLLTWRMRRSTSALQVLTSSDCAVTD